MKYWLLIAFWALAANGQEFRGDSLIRAAIARKSQNDPQKRLASFSYESYNRMIVTAEPGSIPTAIDTVNVSRIPGIRIMKPDSSLYKFARTIRKQHLFQVEKASNIEYDGKRLKETVAGAQMAGFRQPVYEVFGFGLQSFSLYDNRYELLETKYQSPLAPDAWRVYEYVYSGSENVAGRSSHKIAFFHRTKNTSGALAGTLWLDAGSLAVSHASLRIDGMLNISAEHGFTYLPEYDLWFPESRELRIVKGTRDADIRILGATISFDAVADPVRSRRKEASDYTYFTSLTTHSNIRTNVPVLHKRPRVSVHVPESAIHRDTDFWKLKRREPLDSRSVATYSALDSITEREKIEGKIRFGRKIINGYIPLGGFDLDLRHILSYNNYEGFRLGLGGVTNERFSEKFRLEGYSAYGTKDGNFKYSIGGAARIGRTSASWFGASYTDDVREIANTLYAVEKRAFKLYDPRPINVSTFYSHTTYRAYLESRLFPKTESIWQLTQSFVQPEFTYVFAANNRFYDRFNLTLAQVSFQWNPLSDFMQTPRGRIEYEKGFPKFTFQATRSIPGFLANDFDFTKLEFRAEYDKKYLNGQKSSVVLEAGYASAQTPLTHLFNTSPNNLTKDRLLQRVTLAGKNAFETMYFNEFFSSRFAMLQLKHGSRRVTIFRKVRPSMVLVTRMAFGSMQQRERHIGVGFKTLEDGYFESGVELNQIYSGFGLSGFYRYGPNQLARFEDNLALKISFVLNLGI